MTTADETAPQARFERDRREADARYNDALTALDRAIVSASQQPALTRDDVARLATALIVFLQQITAFVEAKDRELAHTLGERIDGFAQALEPLAEVRTRMSVIQRSVQALSRGPVATPASADRRDIGRPPDPPLPAPSPVSVGNAAQYVAFEDQFRGSDAAIADKLGRYVPIFSGATHPVVDLGCGRGELLVALKRAGVPARGVDANAAMADIARAGGVDAVHGDALAFLESAADESLGGVIATQVVEHLEPAYLTRLLEAAARKMKPGAPIVLETINAACWLAFFSSYIRDVTHVRPIHPDTLQYLLRASGFERVEIRYSAPVPDVMKMKTFDLAPDILTSSNPGAAALRGLAQAVNANAVILNSLMFTHLDYAAIGYRI